MKRRALLEPVTLGKDEPSSNKLSAVLQTAAIIVIFLILMAGILSVLQTSIKARAEGLAKEAAAQPLTASAAELQADLNKKYNLSLSDNQVKELNCVLHRTGPRMPLRSTCFTDRQVGVTATYGSADVTRADGTRTHFSLVSQSGGAALIETRSRES